MNPAYQVQVQSLEWPSFLEARRTKPVKWLDAESLDVLWTDGPSTVRHVFQTLSARLRSNAARRGTTRRGGS